MRRKLAFSILGILILLACNFTPPSLSIGPSLPTDTPLAPTETASLTPTVPFTPTLSFTETPSVSETPTALPTDTRLPTVESLDATVTERRLSCRYGPGPEYLYLFAYRGGAPVKLIGRVNAENWIWVLVENQIPCWVNSSFLSVEGDIKTLPIVYPEVAKLPITPYYRGTTVLSAQRNPDTHQIIVAWQEVLVGLGDYEDESMQTYIIEVWRCQDGKLIFEPLATRFAYISFVDQPGCSEPSHGRVWVQEKHGYAGPAEIPWPPYSQP